MQPLAIVASGMVTAVGLSAAASCAAMRCAIDNFTETRFIDGGGEWIMGAQVPLEQPWRGMEKLVRMAASAVSECLTKAAIKHASAVALLLCVAEPTRAGRLDELDEQLLARIEAEVGGKFHPQSRVFANGRTGAAAAMMLAHQLIHGDQLVGCVIVGVDSFLSAATLANYESKARLLTSKNSNGFIPGEAAAAVFITRPSGQPDELLCVGLGQGKESATIESEDPLRADGMVKAFKMAMREANLTFAKVDYRLTDLNGEQYGFKEAALAMTRTLRDRKELFELWHPADCIGETGAAIGPCVLGVALAAAQKEYAPGDGVLCHFSADTEERYAMILQFGEGTRRAP